MSEVLSGARYTFGGLLVLTAWSFCAVKVYEARVDAHVDAMVTAQSDTDRLLLKWGPGDSEVERLRYNELMREAE